MASAKVENVKLESVWQRKETPSFMNMLVNLEYHLITGHPAKRAARAEEKKWSTDLANRLNRCMEKPQTYDCYTLCGYISFLQYNDTRVKPYSPDEKEYIASLIKDYLLTYDELQEYKDYIARIEKRA